MKLTSVLPIFIESDYDDAWGDYATTINIQSLAVSPKTGNSATPDLARLRGKRLVLAAENAATFRLDEALMKTMTGQDTIVARPLYSKPIEFMPQFKIVIATNELPIVPEEDAAFWRRCRCVPFKHSIPADKRDKELLPKLKREAGYILAWGIQGHLSWRKNGLVEPRCVTQATIDYRDDMDLLAPWIEEFCVLDQWIKTPTRELRSNFGIYCESQEIPRSRVLSPRSFGRKLSAKGFKSIKIGRARGWQGIGLRSDAEEEALGTF